MTAATDPAMHAQLKSPGDANVPLGVRSADLQSESRDLYAESELQMRHERTERMIRKAREQA